MKKIPIATKHNILNSITIKLTAVLLVAVLLVPAVAMAAKDDVTLSGNELTILSVNGNNFNIVGAVAVVESITVNPSNFSFVFLPGSYLKITSSDRKILSNDATSGFVRASTCSSSESLLDLSWPAGMDGTSITITVTPSSSTCSTGGGGGNISAPSSGGGGGGGYVAPVITTTTPTPVVQTTTTVTPSTSSISVIFAKTLKKGMSESDVKRLQQLLNSDPDTVIASSGVGSPGNETNYYGSLTEKAVQKFQAKYGIVSSGTPITTGYGLVGPSTRTKLTSIFATGVPPASTQTDSTPATTVSPALSGIVFSKGLSRGQSSSDIKSLQQLLNSDPDTVIASSGVGSPGNETNYYGSLTEKAVQKFQAKYGIAGSGDPGYGYVGPKTRAKLNELFSSSSSSLNNDSETLEDALQAQLDALKAQLDEMLSQTN